MIPVHIQENKGNHILLPIALDINLLAMIFQLVKRRLQSTALCHRFFGEGDLLCVLHQLRHPCIRFRMNHLRRFSCNDELAALSHELLQKLPGALLHSLHTGKKDLVIGAGTNL